MNSEELAMRQDETNKAIQKIIDEKAKTMSYYGGATNKQLKNIIKEYKKKHCYPVSKLNKNKLVELTNKLNIAVPDTPVKKNIKKADKVKKADKIKKVKKVKPAYKINEFEKDIKKANEALSSLQDDIQKALDFIEDNKLVKKTHDDLIDIDDDDIFKNIEVNDDNDAYDEDTFKEKYQEVYGKTDEDALSKANDDYIASYYKKDKKGKRIGKNFDQFISGGNMKKMKKMKKGGYFLPADEELINRNMVNDTIQRIIKAQGASYGGKLYKDMYFDEEGGCFNCEKDCGSGLKKVKRQMSKGQKAWVKKVKDYAKKHKIIYGEALKALGKKNKKN